jgi:hypothetical protein
MEPPDYRHGMPPLADLFPVISDEDLTALAADRHCQLSGPRPPFSGLARLARGSIIGE